jgi:hypothetical protein
VHHFNDPRLSVRKSLFFDKKYIARDVFLAERVFPACYFAFPDGLRDTSMDRPSQWWSAPFRGVMQKPPICNTVATNRPHPFFTSPFCFIIAYNSLHNTLERILHNIISLMRQQPSSDRVPVEQRRIANIKLANCLFGFLLTSLSFISILKQQEEIMGRRNLFSCHILITPSIYKGLLQTLDTLHVL